MLPVTGKYSAVVIGVSAGGLAALSAIIEKIPANYSIPVIIVQHRVKDQKDLLEDLLQSKSLIKVKQADEKEKIKAGVIYIAPPDYHLLVENNHTFSLSADKAVSYSRPSIDVLFETAAAVYQKELVGIILTGANRDGADGIKAVRSYGGLTIAQDPAEAIFPFMPKAAIDTNAVQHILSLAGISKLLLQLTGNE